MAVLKFRVMYEDDDSIFRDIEIKPSQSFSDFESTIIMAYGLPTNGSGTFYMSNDNWKKGPKLSIEINSIGKKTKGKSKATEIPPIVRYIDDPHQHFLFEFTSNVEFSFLVELLTLGSAENSSTVYPVVVRSQGASPFKKEVIAGQIDKKKKKVSTAKEEEIVVAEEEEDEPEDEKSPFIIGSAEQASDEELAELSEDADVVDTDDEKEIGGTKEEMDEEAFDDIADFDADNLTEDYGAQQDDEDTY